MYGLNDTLLRFMDNRQLSEPVGGVSAPGGGRERIPLAIRIAAMAARHAIILLGIAASVSYSLWAVLEKVATPQTPAVINLIVYGTAFVFSLAGLRSFRPPTASALVAGFAGGAINGIVLVMLQRHALALVFPFVSGGSVCFIALSFLLIDERLEVRSQPRFWVGVLTTILGLVTCGMVIGGGFHQVVSAVTDIAALCLAALISILTGIWLLFAFVTISRHKYRPLIATTWVFFGSFTVSIIIALLTSAAPRRPILGATSGAAVLAGMFMFVGELATYYGFASATAPTNRAEHILTGLLANSELLPVLLVSIFIFKDVSPTAIIGCVLVLIGIGVLNSARR
jgi:drug/metabolite transporter (DMT)-like permease